MSRLGYLLPRCTPSIRAIGMRCFQCEEDLDYEYFSRNQQNKGSRARCADCVSGVVRHSCRECDRVFADENELRMHSQVHRPRMISCPICGDQRFKSPANAVQHVESGTCRNCPGKNNAREHIHRFATTTAASRFAPYLTSAPMIADGEDLHHEVSEFPYHCPYCLGKKFRALSQLMQHADQKHNSRALKF